MLSLSTIRVGKEAPVNPISSIFTAISGGLLLAVLAVGSRSGKLVLTKKRFRRLLARSNQRSGIRISINNWTTGSLFDSLCRRSLYCDERRSKMTMIVMSNIALKLACGLVASGLFDLIETVSSPPRGVEVVSDLGRRGVESYIAGIGLVFNLLCF